MTRTSTLVAVFLLFGPAAVLAAVGGDPRSLPSLKRDWTYSQDVQSMVLADSTLYVLEAEGTLLALDAATGEVAWSQDLAPGSYLEGSGPVVLADVVAVGVGSKAFILDPATGKLLHQVDLGGVIRELVGPPLVAVVNAGSGRQYVALDETGSPRRFRDAGEIVYDIAMADGVVLAIQGMGDGAPNRIVGLEPETLEPRWTHTMDVWPDFVRVRGGFCLMTRHNETAVYLPISPTTGELQSPLPFREATDGFGELTWELQYLEKDDGTFLLRRSGVADGSAQWVDDVPARPLVSLVVDDVLYVHCEPEAGRGYLVVIDWSSGKVLHQAYGLTSVQELIPFRDRLIARTLSSGVVVFAGNEFGPSEASSRSVSQEVHRILSELDEMPVSSGGLYGYRDAVAELRTLGPAALPSIEEEIPSVGPMSLQVAAIIVQEARYPEAASPLLDRVVAGVGDPDEELTLLAPEVFALRALAAVGRPEHVSKLISILKDSGRSEEVVEAATLALAAIGTPEAIAAIAPRAPEESASTSWFAPPDYQEFLSDRGWEIDREEAIRLHESGAYGEAWDLAYKGRTAFAARPDGGGYLVFPDSLLGGADNLWLGSVDSSGNRLPAIFLGLSVHVEESSFSHVPVFISCELEGRTLRIWRRREPNERFSVNLDEVVKDSDGDGLTDTLERWIYTDPGDPDTDHDGRRDAVDRAPNARIAAPRSEEQAIMLAVFEHFFTVGDGKGYGDELVIVVSPDALEWRGRSGPTVTLSAAENDEFTERAGYDGIAHIRIEPEDAGVAGEIAGYTGTGSASRPPEAEERKFSFTTWSGGLAAGGYDVLVKRVGDKWVVTSFIMTWIS